MNDAAEQVGVALEEGARVIVVTGAAALKKGDCSGLAASNQPHGTSFTQLQTHVRSLSPSARFFQAIRGKSYNNNNNNSFCPSSSSSTLSSSFLSTSSSLSSSSKTSSSSSPASSLASSLASSPASSISFAPGRGAQSFGNWKDADPRCAWSSMGNGDRMSASPSPPRRGSGLPRGLTGLQNLGNTCFMNSALQCMSNTPQLILNYFVAGRYNSEINETNPLGMQGAIAHAFADLMQRMWRSPDKSHHHNGSNYVVSPSNLKATIGRFAPQFKNYNQQDSQELLGFLLDGLHEDLNRIKNKPYSEAPDESSIPDAELADLQWTAHKARNDSVIVDFFQGQYKSRVCCLTCSNESIKFDPFMILSLPIPVKRRHRCLRVVLSTISCKLVLTNVFVYSTMAIGDLVDLVSRGLGLSEHVIFVECFNGRVTRIYRAHQSIEDILSASAEILAFEVPQIPLVLEKSVAAGVYSTIPTSSASSASSPSSPSSNDTLQNGIIASGDSATATETPESLTPMPTYKDLDKELPTYTEALGNSKAGFYSEPAYEPVFLTVVNAVGKIVDVPVLVCIPRCYDAAMTFEIAAMALSSRSGYKIRAYRAQNPDVALDQIFCIRMFSNAAIHENAQIRKYDQLRVSFCSVEASDTYHGASGFTGKEEQEGEEEEEEERKESQVAEGKKEEQNATEHTLQKGNEEIDRDGNNSCISTSAENSDAAEFTLQRLRNGNVREENLPEAENQQNPQASLFRAAAAKPEAVSTAVPHERYSYVEGRARAKIVDSVYGCDRNTLESGGGGMQSKRNITLDDCLDAFAEEERLDSRNPVYCTKCKRHRVSSKKVDLWRVPPVLVLALKRFGNSGSHARHKLDVDVQFPHELSLGERTLSLGASEYREAEYELYAVSNHYGSLGGGHYTAYARNPTTNTWHEYDDSRVSASIALSKVQSSAAYVLFYTLKNPHILTGESGDEDQAVWSGCQSEDDGESTGTE